MSPEKTTSTTGYKNTMQMVQQACAHFQDTEVTGALAAFLQPIGKDAK